MELRAALACALVAIPPFLAGALAGQADAPDPPPIRVGFVSDAQEEGERPQLRAALRELERMNASLLIYGGDTSYGWKPPPADWVDALGPFVDRTLFVVGNHDDGTAYDRWRPADRKPGDTWWTVRLGNVSLIALDTERNLTPGSLQHEWLLSTLEKTRNDTVVLAMHIAWWVSHEGPRAKHHAFPGVAEEMDALVGRYGVDAVLAAHEHYYARLDRDGVPYVLNGRVEARAHPVHDAIARQAVVVSHDESWIHFDVLPCGVAFWSHRVAGGLLDRFAIPAQDPHEPARLVMGEEEAECRIESSVDPGPVDAPAPEAPKPDAPASAALGESVGGAPREPDHGGKARIPTAGGAATALAMAAWAAGTGRRRDDA